MCPGGCTGSVLILGAAACRPAIPWQDLEAKESDLWGSRGVTLVGLSMLHMAAMNFRGTVASILAKARAKGKRAARLTAIRAKTGGVPESAAGGAADGGKQE